MNRKQTHLIPMHFSPWTTMWSADRNSSGGGVIAYLRSDVAGTRRPDLESIGVEIAIKFTKGFFLCCYKPPAMKDDNFVNDSISTLDKIFLSSLILSLCWDILILILISLCHTR